MIIWICPEGNWHHEHDKELEEMVVSDCEKVEIPEMDDEEIEEFIIR